MYKIGFVVASGELITYPWMNPQSLFADSRLYEFCVFQQEQCARLFAEMELGALDGVIFSSNVSNDGRVCDLIQDNKDIIENFVNQGKGVLILLQYHLAKRGEGFNIISKRIFLGDNQEEKEVLDKSDDHIYNVTSFSEQGENNVKEQNAVVLTGSNLDLSKVYWDGKSLLLSYPNKITCEQVYNQSQNSKYVKSFAPAYISEYPHAYFAAPFCVQMEGENNSKARKPLLIYSLNENKRIVITTIPADLQEHKELMENMISYIARGRPEAILWKDDSCSVCRGNCDTEDYLKRAKVHYFKTTDKEFKEKTEIINRAKYVVACGATAYKSYREKAGEITLPIRTSLNNITECKKSKKDKKDERIVVEIPAVSQIESWADQGFDYLLSRFPQNEKMNNRWDSLYATKQVVLLAQEIGRNIPEYIVEQIKKYLAQHNQDNESFDKVDRATMAAAEICKILKIDLNFKSDLDTENYEPAQITHETILSNSLFDLAQYVLNAEKLEEIQEIYEITARFIVERDFKKASWEDDVITTASVLRALVRIDRCTSINTSVINIVGSCYDDMGCNELTKALSLSIERARQSEYEVRRLLEMNNEHFNEEMSEKETEITQKDTEIDLLKRNVDENEKKIAENEELNKSLKNRNTRLQAWIAVIGGLLVYFVLLLFVFIFKAFSIEREQYIGTVIDFFATWGIGGMILTIIGSLVAIILFKVIYRSDLKK